MSTIEILLLGIMAVIAINFFYVLFKKPFWNLFKQAVWNTWNGLCLIILGILFVIYAINTERINGFFLLAVFVATFVGYISTKMIEAKFCAVMYEEIHFFRITSFVGKKIYGELAITGSGETVPARLVCPLHADYKYNDIIPVTVLLCKQNEIIVEPTEN